MPITNTLENAKRLESLGFTAEQSRGLSELLEETAQSQVSDLKAFFRAELGAFEQRMDAKIDAVRNELKAEIGEVRMEIKDLRAEMYAQLHQQTLRFVTVLIGVVTVAVAVMKLFPDLY